MKDDQEYIFIGYFVAFYFQYNYITYPRRSYLVGV